MADRDGNPASILPPQRAFVLQLQVDAQVGPHSLAGRLEHTTSGRATRFGSLDELLALIARTLEATAGRAPPRSGS
jgi:hypothetical protein